MKLVRRQVDKLRQIRFVKKLEETWNLSIDDMMDIIDFKWPKTLKFHRYIATVMLTTILGCLLALRKEEEKQNPE